MSRERCYSMCARRLSPGVTTVFQITVAVLLGVAWCGVAHGSVTVFDPTDATHLAEDASHFASDVDPNHYADWTEWWYFNFHEPGVEDGWDGFIVFHTKGDLRADGGSHFVQVIVAIWNGGNVRWVQSYPLLGQNLSGYSSSTTKCDVSIKAALTHTCAATYNTSTDDYTIHVSDTAGLSLDLTFDRISKGFLPGLQGFPDSDWRDLFWVVPMPYAEVTGTITLPGVGQKTIEGTGYHDHNWGHWNEMDVVWDWGECPIPSEDATIIFGNVDRGQSYGTVGVVVAVDDTGLIAWAETDSMNVTYKNGWSGTSPSNYPNVDHVYGKRANKTIEIESSIDYHLPGFDTISGYMTEIMAGYSGKVYKSNKHSDVILTVSSNTSKGFLEYKDSNGESDTTAPGAPSNLSATTVSCTRIDLSWTAPSGSPVGYNIFRSEQSGGPYLYTGTAKNATSYQDRQCKDGTTYYYVVTAYDSVPNEGSQSSQASATTNTGCPEICYWPRDYGGGGYGYYMDRSHMRFDTYIAGPLQYQYRGEIIVGNLGSANAFDSTVIVFYGTPSTGAGTDSTRMTFVGDEYIHEIPPYGQVVAGPFEFTTPPEGNEFGESYWMVMAIVASPTDPFDTGAPWDDNNVAVLNYWEITAPGGEPTELHFWMENSDDEPALMALEIDCTSCGVGWEVKTSPPAGEPQLMAPGQREGGHPHAQAHDGDRRHRACNPDAV